MTAEIKLMTEKRMNKNQIKNLIKIIGKILMILSVIFIIIKIKDLGFDISVVDNIPAFIGVSIAALALNMLSTVIMALVWGNWISFFSGTKVNNSNVITIYGKSSIGKYLPGNVMHYVERNLFAAEYGLSQDKIAFSSVMEIIGQVISAALISVLLLPQSFRQKVLEVLGDNSKTLLLIGGLGIAVSAVIVLILAFKKIKIKNLLSGYKAGTFAKTLVVNLSGSIVYLILNGCGMLALWGYCSASLPDIESIRLIVSSYAAAWVCGFVIPGAPGGIGIREAVLSILLDDMTGGVLMFLIVVHRLITVIGDFAIYFIVSFLPARREE